MRFMDTSAATWTEIREGLDLWYRISGTCCVTGKDYSVVITFNDAYRLAKGEMIQDVLDYVPKEQREFLISGVSPEGWNLLFASHEVMMDDDPVDNRQYGQDG